VKNNQSACRQDDGDCILNNDALIMAVVLLFDSAVNDYGGDSDSGDSLSARGAHGIVRSDDVWVSKRPSRPMYGV
jgi:hypothetical protein